MPCRAPLAGCTYDPRRAVTAVRRPPSILCFASGPYKARAMVRVSYCRKTRQSACCLSFAFSFHFYFHLCSRHNGTKKDQTSNAVSVKLHLNGQTDMSVCINDRTRPWHLLLTFCSFPSTKFVVSMYWVWPSPA